MERIDMLQRMASMAKFAAAVLAGGLPALGAWNFFDPADEAQIPGTVSALGLYTDMTSRTLTPEAVHYDINSPFYADGAVNQRFVILPPGKQILFNDSTDLYRYPDSATFLNNFFIDKGPDHGGLMPFETRILTLKKKVVEDTIIVDQWHGYTYVWRPDGSDADLVSPGKGLDTTIQVFPEGTAGAPVGKKWRYPSQDACQVCHIPPNPYVFPQARTVLGFYTAQLNRPLPGSPGKNQITHFFEIGLFGPATPAVNPASLPKFAGLMDTGATLEHRARSYMAGQCSGCHGDRGYPNGGTGGMTEINFDYYDLQPHGDPWAGRWVTNQYGLDHCNGEAVLVRPGDPTCSVMIFRQTKRNGQPERYEADGDQMPPLGTFAVNKEAIRILSEWVCSLDPAACAVACPNGSADCVAGVVPRVAREALKGPWLDARRLLLPPSLTGPSVKVDLRDMQGKVVPLRKVAEGVYDLPETVSRGMYAVKVDGREFPKFVH